jgi:beta-glucanase (GH16 family)
MSKQFILLSLICLLPFITQAQILEDDFEGNGTITSWFGDDCGIDINFTNPYSQGINTSATVLKYDDQGGPYANVRFDIGNNFDLSDNYTFSVKIYVPTSGLTGSQPNQVSLKLQDGTLGAPWSTQSEIIKTISLDQWQTLTFDFKNDNYINLDAGSPPPTQRQDFNRVLIQINGENNTDKVLAYIDDFYYDGTLPVEPVYDKLVWSDEFNGMGMIDTSKWFHQTQLPIGGSWYNGEIQHYTNRTQNTYLDGGSLHLVAKKETFTDQGHTKNYTSARLNSKFAFTYGRVEVRAKLPTGAGTWPAIWMLGKNINEDGAYYDNLGYGTTPWPACGEIDIMEHWGTNQNFVQSATHTPSSFGATVNHGGKVLPTASTGFHVYAVAWSPEKLVFSVDSIVHYTYKPLVQDSATWPYTAEQYLLLNIAIEPTIAPAFTESTMEIDYVRVYQQFGLSVDPDDDAASPIFYPNPVEDELNIQVENAEGKALSVQIYGMDGKLIETYEERVLNGQVVLRNIGQLPKGMYLGYYELNNKKYSLKFIKK